MLIRLENVEKRIKGETLFAGASLELHKGDGCGLIGANGAGKTTLLEIIAGRSEVDKGEIIKAADFSTGFLPQTLKWTESGQVQEYLWGAFSYEQVLAEKLRELEEKISQDYRESLLEEYARVTGEFEKAGGYSCESRIRGVMTGLGFSPEALKRELKDFSGGEKTRIALARLLLERPDLLLLDEPTNHLDRENREWLAEFLENYGGAILVVSHDRYFLDRVVQRIYELEAQRLYSFPGNYSQYREQRGKMVESWKKEYNKQQEEIESLKEFIRRYKAGQRSREARAREKRLARMQPIPPPPQPKKGFNLNLQMEKTSGQEVLKAENIAFILGDDLLFSDVNLEIRRGEKVALLGPNGAGKTTLLKILLGMEKPSTGTVSWGHNVIAGYFPQEGANIPRDKNLFQVIAEAGLNYRQEIMDLLGAFRFGGEDGEKRVGELSGGELARLNLALLSLQKANVLLLDEPTNHLDLEFQEGLEEAVKDFSSTVIFTSHDRYFIERVAGVFWKLEEGRLWTFRGNYQEFLEKEKTEKVQGEKSQKKTVKKQKDKKKDKSQEENVNLKRKQLEERIASLEAELKEMEKFFMSPDFYRQQEVEEQGRNYKIIKDELDKLYRLWEETLG